MEGDERGRNCEVGASELLEMGTVIYSRHRRFCMVC